MNLVTNANKTVIVTGGNSGLGFETARAILQAGDGWHVVIAGRSAQRCEEAASRLSHETGTPSVEAISAGPRLAGGDPAVRYRFLGRQSAATAGAGVQRRGPARRPDAANRGRFRVHVWGQPPRPFPAGEPDAATPGSSRPDHLRQQRHARPESEDGQCPRHC